MPDVRRSPYQGLDPYGPGDRDFFVGRERDTDFIAATILTRRLTVLHGESGVGKTSLLQAGVAPALAETPTGVVVVFREWLTADYPANLRQKIEDALRARSQPVPDAADFAEFLAAAGGSVDLFLIFDQFEDYFVTRGPKDWLNAPLAHVLRDTEASVNVVLSLRSDTLYLLDPLQDLIPYLFANSLRVEHLTVEDGRRAIETPLARYKERYAAAAGDKIADPPIEAGLTDLIIQGVADRPLRAALQGRDSPITEGLRGGGIETAFLQIILSRLWEEERQKKPIQLKKKTLEETLHGIGNIALDYVRQRIQAAAGEISKAKNKAVQDDVLRLSSLLFDRLVAPSGRSVPYSAEELATTVPGDLQSFVPDLLNLLVRYRVLKPVSSSAEGPPMYEMMHDVLGEAVIRWQTEYRQKLQVRKEIQQTQQSAASYFRRFWVAVCLLAITILAFIAFGQKLANQKLQVHAATLTSTVEQSATELTAIRAQVSAQARQITERDNRIAELMRQFTPAPPPPPGPLVPVESSPPPSSTAATQARKKSIAMFKSIDVLIGLSLVMLVVSMAITMLTQAITSLLQSRGRHLLEGIARLTLKLDPGLSSDDSRAIARAVLTHPLIGGGRAGLGTTIHRAELIGVLLELAASGQDLPSALADRLKNTLQLNGISDPAKTLQDIRVEALNLERKAPHLANHMRHEMAIVRASSTEFVSKIHSWFDSTMDRVSEQFTAHARLITFVSAAVVTAVLQLDTVALVNRLSMDDALRDALSVQAQAIAKSQTDPNAPKTDTQDRYVHALEDIGIVSLPRDFQHWKHGWTVVNPLGVVITALLLTLGAPFWYDVLKKLINLKSVIASKDDEERNRRQQTDTTIPPEILDLKEVEAAAEIKPVTGLQI
ncbi:MAG: hypothetical protein U0Q18_06925 [Bryobacteraceae bacterium]